MKWLLHKLGISQLIADFRNQLFVLNHRQTQQELRISGLKDEINYLYETKKWNKAYKLEQIELGKTEIKPVENVLQLLM